MLKLENLTMIAFQLNKDKDKDNVSGLEKKSEAFQTLRVLPMKSIFKR